MPDWYSASTNLDQCRRFLRGTPINCLALGTGRFLPFGFGGGLNETASGLAGGLGRIGMTHAVRTIHNHLAVDGGDPAGSIEGRSHRCSCLGADRSNRIGRQTGRRCACRKGDLTGRLSLLGNCCWTSVRVLELAVTTPTPSDRPPFLGRLVDKTRRPRRLAQRGLLSRIEALEERGPTPIVARRRSLWVWMAQLGPTAEVVSDLWAADARPRQRRSPQC